MHQSGSPERCIKTRGVVPDHCLDCGAIEPLAFLHAWLSTDPAPTKKHTTTDPLQTDVVAFAVAHKAELEALVARRAPP